MDIPQLERTRKGYGTSANAGRPRPGDRHEIEPSGGDVASYGRRADAPRLGQAHPKELTKLLTQDAYLYANRTKSQLSHHYPSAVHKRTLLIETGSRSPLRRDPFINSHVSSLAPVLASVLIPITGPQMSPVSLFFVTTSTFGHWVICVPAAFLRCGSRF